jgi:hypothetical protein
VNERQRTNSRNSAPRALSFGQTLALVSAHHRAKPW